MKATSMTNLVLGAGVFVVSIFSCSASANTVSTWLYDSAEGTGQVVYDEQYTNNGYLGTLPTVDSADPSRSLITPFAYDTNRSLSFGGSTFGTDVVTVANSSSMSVSSITVEAWFKPEVNPVQYTRLICKGDTVGGTSGSFKIYTKTGDTSTTDRLIWSLNLGGTLREFGTPTDFDVFTFTGEEGDWVHIAATYNSTNGVARIYVNGSQLSATVWDTSGLTSTDTALTVGNRIESDRGFIGTIDEVRLSDVEVASENLGYFGTFGPSNIPEPLTGGLLLIGSLIIAAKKRRIR